jgi:hypothetical protein
VPCGRCRGSWRGLLGIYRLPWLLATIALLILDVVIQGSILAEAYRRLLLQQPASTGVGGARKPS